MSIMTLYNLLKKIAFNRSTSFQEAIMVLENYTKDFHSLIDYINIKRDYDSTPVLNRYVDFTWPNDYLLLNISGINFFFFMLKTNVTCVGNKKTIVKN